MFDFFLPKFLFPSRKGSYIPIHFDEIVVKLYFLGFQVVVMFKNKEVGWLLKLMFLSILMMLVFSLVFFRLEADSNIIEMTKIRVREMASKNVRIISYHIQLCQTELDVLAEATEMSAKDDELQALLDTQLVKGHFDRITLYDSLRRPILSAHMEEQYAAERSELPSIRIGREVFFENNFICVMRPIEKDGIHVGYLLGEISEANFTKEINLTDHGDMGFANLITADGETLLVSNPSSILHMGSSFWDVFRSIRFKSPYSYHLMYEQISSQQPGYVYYYTTDGKPRMAYFEPAGYENWYIFQVASENAIEAQSAPLQMILIEVMLFMAIAYFVLIFITFTISKRYNRSLVEAQKQAEMLEKNIPGGVISFIPSENGEIDYISGGLSQNSRHVPYSGLRTVQRQLLSYGPAGGSGKDSRAAGPKHIVLRSGVQPGVSPDRQRDRADLGFGQYVGHSGCQGHAQDFQRNRGCQRDQREGAGASCAHEKSGDRFKPSHGESCF